MRNDASTVGIAPGDGLIARFGAVVVYLARETPSTDRILGAIEAAADARHPGAAIAQRLAAVVFGGNSEPPPFGVIAPTADGTVILLRGQVSAELQGAEGTRRLSGARAFTWVDEIVREPVRRIMVGADSAFPIHELPRTDLRAGIVPGSGFILRIAARRTGKSAPTRTRTTGTPSPAEPPPTAPAGLEALHEPTAKPEATPTGQHVGSPQPAGSGQPHTTRSAESARNSDRSDDPDRSAEGTRAAVSAHRSLQRSAAEYDELTEKAGSTGPMYSGRSPQQSIADSTAHDEPNEKAGPGPTGSTGAARPGAASSEARRSGSAPSGGSGQADAPEEIGTQAMSAREREEAAGTRAGAAARPEPIALHKIPALQGVRPRPLRPVGGANNQENSGARQPVGALVLADGSAFPLDRPYVVGRSPMIDETVRAATATPLAVPRDRHVSRVHAYVSVDHGKVYVRDAATPAGTFIAAPGADEWTRIGTTPTELHPGWSLRIGQRILTYRANDRLEHPTEATSKRRRPS
ncbi:FHA domain-containing protein [Nocardia anaemiae]|uniref:FHA domain-containing protein n=1 Tax=Nocardia anaemiae TaxID=263910 RepID=UPI000AAEE0FB|nr:FHA domain-containing protein [Nocardia anaemiae]